MASLPTGCPSCGEPLEVTRMTCPGCSANVEGRFALPELVRLSREDQEFILAFVRASGSLKDLGAQLGVSYPTVRNRLNEVIARLGEAPDIEKRRKEILDAIAHGKLSVKEGARKLKELGS